MTLGGWAFFLPFWLWGEVFFLSLTSEVKRPFFMCLWAWVFFILPWLWGWKGSSAPMAYRLWTTILSRSKISAFPHCKVLLIQGFFFHIRLYDIFIPCFHIAWFLWAIPLPLVLRFFFVYSLKCEWDFFILPILDHEGLSVAHRILASGTNYFLVTWSWVLRSPFAFS